MPLPTDLSDEQAASFFVNPASALAMTRYVLKVPRGAWLLQTAAGSQLGRMVIRLGQLHGFKTLNIVRRKEQKEELTRLGGTAVVATNEEPLVEGVMRLTNNEGVLYALDAVGGETGTQAISTLGRGGRLLVYGALSLEPIVLDPRVLLLGQKRVEGFWLSEWVRDQGILTMLLLFRKIGQLMRGGTLATEVGKAFALTEIREAMQHAAQPGRQGKTLLRINSR